MGGVKKRCEESEPGGGVRRKCQGEVSRRGVKKRCQEEVPRITGEQSVANCSLTEAWKLSLKNPPLNENPKPEVWETDFQT